MSKSLGHRLPDVLSGLLRGTRQDSGNAIVLATVDGSGRPHFCLLSVSEVVAVAPDRLRIGTYATSATSQNLRDRGTYGLCIVEQGHVYYVKGRVQELPSVASIPGIARFEARVEDVLVDATREEEGGAAVLTGITFKREQPATALGDALRA